MKIYQIPGKIIHRFPQLLKWLSDEKFLQFMFWYKTGKKLQIKNPRTYNEKLQWIKLNDRDPSYTLMVDKYEAKKYVESIIGAEYIVPTYGVWDQFDEIDFDKLPDAFVLKCTHDSGGIVICDNKRNLDFKKARKKINKSLKRNYYWAGREWPYKNVNPRIIAEQYLGSSKNKPINDYKVYVFGGNAYMMMINSDRGIDTRADYFDRNYNWLDFTWGYKHADILPTKPKNYELMFNLAEKIAGDLKQLRVDFYEVDGAILFGEMTFFDGGGFDSIEPYEWDLRLGNMINLK